MKIWWINLSNAISPVLHTVSAQQITAYYHVWKWYVQYLYYILLLPKSNCITKVKWKCFYQWRLLIFLEYKAGSTSLHKIFLWFPIIFLIIYKPFVMHIHKFSHHLLTPCSTFPQFYLLPLLASINATVIQDYSQPLNVPCCSCLCAFAYVVCSVWKAFSSSAF